MLSHPVYAAAASVADDHPYPAAVICAAVELYDVNVEILDRRPLFGDVAESLALATLSVADYLGADTVRLALLLSRQTPADRLTRERFSR